MTRCLPLTHLTVIFYLRTTSCFHRHLATMTRQLYAFVQLALYSAGIIATPSRGPFISTRSASLSGKELLAEPQPRIYRNPKYGEAWVFQGQRFGIVGRDVNCECFQPNSTQLHEKCPTQVLTMNIRNVLYDGPQGRPILCTKWQRLLWRWIMRAW